MKKAFRFLIAYIGFVLIFSIVGLYWIDLYEFGEGISKYMTVLGPTLSICFVVKYGYSTFIWHFLVGLIFCSIAPYYAYAKWTKVSKYLLLLGLFAWWITGLTNYLLVRTN